MDRCIRPRGAWRLAQRGPLLAVLLGGDEQLAFLGLAGRVGLRPIAGVRYRGAERCILAPSPGSRFFRRPLRLIFGSVMRS